MTLQGYVLCVNDYGTPVNFTVGASGDSAGHFVFLDKAFADLDRVINHARITPLKSTVLTTFILQRTVYKESLPREYCM